MYPRFIQLIIQNQLGDLSTHTTSYTSPALTQKVFANMRRVGKGFLGVETSLFEGMLVAGEIQEQGDAEEQVQDDIDVAAAQGADTVIEGEALDACATLDRRVEHLKHDKMAQALEITKLKRRVKQLERGNKERMKDVLMVDNENEKKTEESMGAGDDQEDEPEVQEVVDVVTTSKLITEVVTAASTTIAAAEPQIPDAAITAAPVRVAVASTRRRKGVVIRDPEEESTAIIHVDTKSKDKGKGIMVEEPKPMKKKQQVEIDEEYARKLHEELNKDIDWDVAIDHVKQKAKEDPYVQRYQVMKKRPQTEAQAQRNMIMYLKNVAGFRLDYFKGMSYDDIQKIEEEENKAIQSINETPAQKASKRRKLNEEVKDLK
nr:hypothetical protein [Tanacetum cinerariifolium]